MKAVSFLAMVTVATFITSTISDEVRAQARPWSIASVVATDYKRGISVCLMKDTPSSPSWRAVQLNEPDPGCANLLTFEAGRRVVHLTFPGILGTAIYTCDPTLRFNGPHPCTSVFFVENGVRPGQRIVDTASLSRAITESDAFNLVEPAVVGYEQREALAQSQASQQPRQTGAPGVAAAGGADAAPAAPTAPLKGSVTYKGTYGGSSVTQRGRYAEANELAGAVTIDVKFDGASVVASFRTTGSMSGFNASGLRNGDTCRLFYRTTFVVEGTCSNKEFTGYFQTTGAGRRQTNVEFNASMASLVDDEVRKQQADIARQKKEQEDAAELTRQERLINSLPPPNKR
jgi:hypothetical protein